MSEEHVPLVLAVPIDLPHGSVVRSDVSNSGFYTIAPQFPSAQTLFSKHERIDLASLVVGISEVETTIGIFNNLVSGLQEEFKARHLESPTVGGNRCPYTIFVKAYRVRPHVLQGPQQEANTALEALVSAQTDVEKERLNVIRSFILKFAETVKQRQRRDVQVAKDLTIVLRRFAQNRGAVNLASLNNSCFVEGIQLSEIRLIFGKGVNSCNIDHLATDPRFTVRPGISCRPIVKDRFCASIPLCRPHRPLCLRHGLPPGHRLRRGSRGHREWPWALRRHKLRDAR